MSKCAKNIAEILFIYVWVVHLFDVMWRVSSPPFTRAIWIKTTSLQTRWESQIKWGKGDGGGFWNALVVTFLQSHLQAANRKTSEQLQTVRDGSHEALNTNRGVFLQTVNGPIALWVMKVFKTIHRGESAFMRFSRIIFPVCKKMWKACCVFSWTSNVYLTSQWTAYSLPEALIWSVPSSIHMTTFNRLNDALLLCWSKMSSNVRQFFELSQVPSFNPRRQSLNVDDGGERRGKDRKRRTKLCSSWIDFLGRDEEK